MPNGKMRHKDKTKDELQNDLQEMQQKYNSLKKLYDTDIIELKKAEEEIRKSKQRYHNLFENTGIAIWEEDLSEVKNYIQKLKESGIYDLRLYFDEHIDEVIKCTSMVKLLDINKEVLNLVKAKSKKEVIKSLPTFFIKESLDAVKEELIGLSEGKLRIEGEIPLKILTGEIKQVLFQLTIVSGYEDTWEKALFSFIDITERKRTEESLRFFRTLIDKSNDAIEVIDVETAQFIDVNEKACADLGYSRDELLKMSVFDIDPNQTVEIFQSLMDEIQLSNSKIIESLHQRKDGSIFPIEINIAVVKLEKIFAIAIVRDITEKKIAENKLNRSEEKYRNLIDHMNDGIFTTDGKGIIQFANNALAHIHGLDSPNKLLNKDFLDFVEPSVRKEILESFQNKIQLGDTDDIEIPIINPNGSIVYILVRPFFIRDGQQIIGMNGIVRDITERKRAEDALRESEEDFRSMFDNNSAAMAIIEPDTTISMVNDEYCRLIGFSKQEIIGTSWTVQIPPEDLNRLKEYNRKRLINANDVPDKYEFTIYNKKGEIRHALMSITMLKNKKRIASFVDITERKRAEEVLSESEKRTKALLNANPDMIFHMNRDGIYLDYKADSTELYAQAEVSIIGKKNRDITPPEFADLVDQYIKKTLDSGELQQFEYQILIPKRGLRNYEARMVASGKDEVITVVRDITERKQTEEEIHLKNEQLLKLNAEKDKFFSIMAHDLKSPFDSIMGFSKILNKQVMEKNYQSLEKYSSFIYQASQRVVDLLTNLMEWSRSQTGRMEFNPEYFEMVKLINEVTLLLAGAASQKSIAITEVLPPNIQVYADKNMMSTVMRNLISNAIKFTNKGGEIFVSTEKKQGEIMVSVRDNGMGIPKNRIEKLFQIDESFSTPGTENEKGTGLGIVLCKEFVEKHGGQIWVESNEGKGSKFNFTLPISN